MEADTHQNNINIKKKPKVKSRITEELFPEFGSDEEFEDNVDNKVSNLKILNFIYFYLIKYSFISFVFLLGL